MHLAVEGWVEGMGGTGGGVSRRLGAHKRETLIPHEVAEMRLKPDIFINTLQNDVIEL